MSPHRSALARYGKKERGVELRPMRVTSASGFERLVAFYQTPSGKKMIRYMLVSVVSTAVSLGVLGLVFGVVHLWSEVPSAVFANAVATVPSYYLNRQWAWGKTGRSHMVKEVLPFWLASFAGLALSTGAAALAHDFSVSHHLHHLGRTVVVLGANLVAYGLLWIGKFLLFNQLFRHPAPAAADDDSAFARDPGSEAAGAGPAQARGSVAEVGELKGDAEVPVLERLDHRL